jgi:DNA-binding PadR family transcriptional regulator
VTSERIRGSPDRSTLVLASLVGGPTHGDALAQDVEHFAGFTLGHGTRDGCPSKPEDAGLVEGLPGRDRRHPYRITPDGLDAVEQRLHESGRMAGIGLRRIVGAQ